ncbi:alpha/beta fold hydrolase [Nocardioides cynanchi]|uniref:alpha/beta fold hydrolase n=1 Tax=Nocardioides cynanchi TaxID=2558918 RepID=UPI001243E06C|nr:alpha/beta hydrolase [Nocardioides cynanchi]
MALIDLDGRVVEYSDLGAPDGLPVLFFHGTPDTRRAAWSGAEAARRAGVRLVAASRPGYGRTTPASPSSRLAVQDAVGLADRLGIASFAVLGMSVGGMFALACAAHHPGRVLRAALVAAPGEAPRMDPPWPRDDLDADRQEQFLRLGAGSVADNVALVTPDFAQYRARVDPDDPDDEALATRWLSSLPDDDRALLLRDAGFDHAAAAREAVGEPSGYLGDAAIVFRPWEFRVEDVVCPVSLWYGEHDANAPVRNGRWLQEHLPRAHLNEVPGVGHLGTLLTSWPALFADLAAP